MTPRDLFQTLLRVAGVILLVLWIPQAVADVLTASAVGHPFVFGTIFRLLWEILVPLWLVCGAKALTRGIYGSA